MPGNRLSPVCSTLGDVPVTVGLTVAADATITDDSTQVGVPSVDLPGPPPVVDLGGRR